MSANSSAVRVVRQSAVADRAEQPRSVLVDQHFALLRQCISDRGYTLDALAAEMSRELPKPIDKGYLWRLLNDPAKHGEWKVAHTVALPDDVELLFKQRQAEAFGLIVVTPASGDEAVRCLVSGLFGVLAPRLPQKSAGQLKVDLR